MPSEPKHREMERLLREDILSGQWRVGERIPAERELSRQFGVAYMTVRQAIGNLVADQLLQRIPGKGTFVLPAHAVVRAVAPAPRALFVPALWRRLDPYYFPDILEGFEEALTRAGQHAAIYDYASADRKDLLPSGSAVACLLIGKEEAELAERLRDQGYRVLAINRYTGRRNIPSIEADNAGGTAQAVDHLVALGHTRIGYLHGVPGNLDALQRQRGFRAAMRRHNLPHDAEAGNDFREEAGYTGVQELLNAQPDLTAFVCASDISAMGAIKAAQDRGLRVPDDLSLVGFGDFSIAPYLLPPLTTVYQPRKELGQAAAHALIALSNGDDPVNALLPTHLVERGSTAPPAG